MLWVHGDSTQDENLLAAHVMEARGLVAATGDDCHNVYVSLTARGLNQNLYIVARGFPSGRGGEAAQGGH